MDAKQALDLIEEIAATSSRTAKEELLASLLDTSIGQFIVKWSYDPFITYGIKPTRHASNLGEKIPFEMDGVEDILTKLSQRQLTGNAATDVVSACLKASDETANELLWRILNKDLRCGIAESTIQRVMPGLIPGFSVMRAHGFEQKRIKTWPQAVEPKLDGYRFTFLCRDGNGGFFTRSGKRAPAAEHLVEPMIQAALTALSGNISDRLRFTLNPKSGSLGRYERQDLNFMVDGEMIVDGSFAETGALRRKSQTAAGAKFHVFDLMSFADFDAIGKVGLAYTERRKLVEAFVHHADPAIITQTPRYLVNSFAEIQELYERFRARGLEGAMVKNPAGLYDKKKSYDWLKIKAEETEDLEIVGAYPGELNTKYENCLGGLIVKRSHNDGFVEVHVGGGFSDKEREELWELWLRDQKRMENPPVYTEEFELVGRLIEVEFHEVTPDGSLRHPRFKRFRDDKKGELESKETA